MQEPDHATRKATSYESYDAGKTKGFGCVYRIVHVRPVGLSDISANKGDRSTILAFLMLILDYARSRYRVEWIQHEYNNDDT